MPCLATYCTCVSNIYEAKVQDNPVLYGSLLLLLAQLELSKRGVKYIYWPDISEDGYTQLWDHPYIQSPHNTSSFLRSKSKIL